ncbi:TMEM175 family protein [Tengunoibacter tsumagoiensis]|uniref:DUF1211 domain-containing membrane protein n=1 Tax=Tengunoibacter tsumagoiensis TaxID=2014871 RepID=A0A402A5Q1_9CHLR|nr:TMEM175 family protein [Tengunoibacter tsumagoiensis]GCE14432.1 DUF1211 domain-containing membrane protein [Tengunoibacter tsumagoiensis]
MDEKETGRLEAFSDGVFAVAITLLVLNIKVPEPDKLLSDANLWKALFTQWPTLAAFVTSFFTIGIMWLNHHRVFTLIKRTDTSLIMINLVLLLIIVFIPVPTELLAEYLLRFDLHTAAIIYAGTFLLMASAFNILWRYASYQGRLLGKHVNMHLVRSINRQFAFGPLLYLICFGLAWFNTPVSLFFGLALALFFAVPGSSLRLLMKREEITDRENNKNDR